MARIPAEEIERLKREVSLERLAEVRGVKLERRGAARHAAAVLVIDELGFQALDRRDAHLLFKVLSSRYEQATTIITPNTSIHEWPEVIAGDEMLATVILDRVLHHCHVVQIDGRSFRLREVTIEEAQA